MFIGLNPLIAILLKEIARRAGKKIGKVLADKGSGSSGSGGTTSQESIDEAILSEKALKELEEMRKRINKKNPVAPKPEPKFDKNRNPITDSKKPKDKLNPLPRPLFIPPEKDVPKGEKERVVLFKQNKSLTQMNWGGLISYPIVYGANGEPERIVLIERTGAVDPNRAANNRAENAEKFIDWISLGDPNLSRSERFRLNEVTLPTLAGQSALLFPENVANLSGELGLLCGAESIRDIYANFASSSNNVYCDGYTLRGVAYGKITVNRTSFDLKNNEFDYSEESIKQLPFEVSNIASAIGINPNSPSLVPTSLIGYTDDELRFLKHQQIQGLKDEIANANLSEDERKELRAELKRLEDEPIRRYKEIRSLADFQAWQTIAIHELIGDFPVKLEWHQSDIIQVGKKPKETPEDNNLPLVEWVDDKTQITRNYSLTGMLRELIISAKFNDGMTGLNLRQGTSTLMEIGMTRQLLTKTHHLIDTIHDWAGIATKTVKKDVMMMFDPNIVNDYDEFLTPTNMEVMVDEIDTKVEKSTVSEAISFIYEGAQIIKITNTVGMASNSRGKWKRRIKGLRGIIDSVSNAEKTSSRFTEDENGNVKESTSSRPRTDFDDDCEAIELGYVADDIRSPFGGTFDERPRIVDVSTNALSKG
jgi:hypothetical protein